MVNSVAKHININTGDTTTHHEHESTPMVFSTKNAETINHAIPIIPCRSSDSISPLKAKIGCKFFHFHICHMIIRHMPYPCVYHVLLG